MRTANRSIRRYTLILLCLALLIFLSGLNAELVLTVYTNGIYPYTSVAQRFVSALFPFAIGDVLYAVLIIYGLWLAFKGIRKMADRQSRKAAFSALPLQLLNVILILYIAFKLLWGLNYSRPSVSTQLGISDTKYTNAQLVSLGDFLIRRLNIVSAKLDTQKARKSFTIQELEAKAKQAYDLMAQQNSFFNYSIPAVKPVIFDWGVTKMGLEGYYNPLSGEANVNMRLPAILLPFVTCHEISHEMSIAREDEANLIGYMTSINSPDLNFQYSGYYNILRNVLFEIRVKSPDDYQLLYQKINKATLADFDAERDFWMGYNSDMYGYMNVALDSFLKINNQRKGVDSYQDIVLWVYNLHRKELSPAVDPAGQKAGPAEQKKIK